MEFENLVPSIQYVVAKHCSPSWHLSDDILRFHNLMLILDGELYISYNSGEDYHTINKGYLVYSPRGVPRKAFTNAESPIYCYAVNFHYAICQKCGEQWTINEDVPELPMERIIPIRNMEALVSLFKEMNREWQGKKKGYMLKCRILLMDIIQRILRENNFHTENGMNLKKVEKVMNFISENHAENIRLNEMADMVGLSPVYFGYTFKKLSGYTPKEYMNFVRIHKARDLLLSGGYTVGEAAEAVGFNDIYYFSRTFKKIIGQKPSEFKN